MKRKIFSALLALAMLLTLAPAALAQEETGPYAESFAFAIYENETETYRFTVSASTGQVSVPGNTPIEGLSFTVVFNEPVEFVKSAHIAEETNSSGSVTAYVPDSSIPNGAIYVSVGGTENAKVNVNLSTQAINFNTPGNSLELTSTDGGKTWTGEKSVSELPQLIDLTLFKLVTNLYNPMYIMADSVKSVQSEQTNQTNSIIFNRDNENVYIREGGPGATLYTVTFRCETTNFSWKFPAGSTLTFPVAPAYAGLTFDNEWYSDSDFKTQVTEETVVNGNMTVYGKYSDATATGDIEKQLSDQTQKVVLLKSIEDFVEFIKFSSVVNPGRIVRLDADIIFPITNDPADRTFTAIQYVGDFDGAGHKIANAIFNASGDNAGLFAVIGSGQKVANLILENITVNNATNSGVLAGAVTSLGGDTSHTGTPLVQNVQVVGGTVDGRNAAGIAGNTFLSEIKYCSVTGTTITGLVNAGGIAAQSYSNINNCYTKDITLNVFPLFYSGGIVATIPEAGTVSHCLTTFSDVCGRVLQDGKEEDSFGDTGNLTPDDVEDAHFDSSIWNLEDPLSDSTFKESAIKYTFEA